MSSCSESDSAASAESAMCDMRVHINPLSMTLENNVELAIDSRLRDSSVYRLVPLDVDTINKPKPAMFEFNGHFAFLILLAVLLGFMAEFLIPINSWFAVLPLLFTFCQTAHCVVIMKKRCNNECLGWSTLILAGDACNRAYQLSGSYSTSETAGDPLLRSLVPWWFPVSFHVLYPYAMFWLVGYTEHYRRSDGTLPSETEDRVCWFAGGGVPGISMFLILACYVCLALGWRLTKEGVRMLEESEAALRTNSDCVKLVNRINEALRKPFRVRDHRSKHILLILVAVLGTQIGILPFFDVLGTGTSGAFVALVIRDLSFPVYVAGWYGFLYVIVQVQHYLSLNSDTVTLLSTLLDRYDPSLHPFRTLLIWWHVRSLFVSKRFSLQYSITSWSLGSMALTLFIVTGYLVLRIFTLGATLSTFYKLGDISLVLTLVVALSGFFLLLIQTGVSITKQQQKDVAYLVNVRTKIMLHAASMSSATHDQWATVNQRHSAAGSSFDALSLPTSQKMDLVKGMLKQLEANDDFPTAFGITLSSSLLAAIIGYLGTAVVALAGQFASSL